MSLIHMKGTITRAVALTVLSAAPAFAGPEFWEPQQTQTGTRQPAVAPRARSSSCAGCSDSVRIKHEVLVTKLDSLRWEFVNRRLTESEQKVLELQMNATLMALREFMEANGTRARVSVTGPAQGGAMAGGTGGSYSYTIQASKHGYIGITFDGPMYGYPAPPARPDVIRFIQYPKIASIDPASPAERAGLLIGDTLLAMNGTDVVENSITLSKILVPEEKVTLRVRRDGDAKEFRVSVAEAPAYIVRRVVPLPAEGFTFVAPPGSAAPAPGAPQRVEVRGRSPDVQAVPMPNSAAPSRLFVFGSAVGGARVQTVTEGLAKALGVKQGVLVTEVPPGSPAFYSGLKDGDVIISAAGDDVATATALTTVLRYADRDKGVKLVIIREKKQQEVLLSLR